MLSAAAATTGVQYAYFRMKTPTKIYCCYGVCTADAQSVCDS